MSILLYECFVNHVLSTLILGKYNDHLSYEKSKLNCVKPSNNYIFLCLYTLCSMQGHTPLKTHNSSGDDYESWIA